MSYCSAIETMDGDRKSLHKQYHDKFYGFPIHDDNELFGRLIMEINQAGLSWETILKKEAGFRKAYHNFNIGKVSSYGERDRTRLLADPGIIRNRLKINAAIENAKTIVAIPDEKTFISLVDATDSANVIPRTAVSIAVRIVT